MFSVLTVLLPRHISIFSLELKVKIVAEITFC